LHDVGKIGIPDRILLRSSQLTAEEFEIVRTHTTLGAEILGQGRSQLLRCAEEIALTHHERWDGTGYPKGSHRRGDRARGPRRGDRRRL
jgi:putative two-component system response regulator